MTDVTFSIIGGFLGAGKTTAIRDFVHWLTVQKGLKVAVITNDQSADLVDSALLRESGITTEEVPGGCFCCRSDLLMETADRIISAYDPDFIIAEPVGSCADLKATVSIPLLEVYGKPFRLNALTVIVDPYRAIRTLALERTKPGMLTDVDYLFIKQLEEADVIVLNKIDLLSSVRLEEIQECIKSRFPGARTFLTSFRSACDRSLLWESVFSGSQKLDFPLDIDYEQYARGEAMMGWLNATYECGYMEGVLVDSELERVGAAVVSALRESAISVTHLKLLATTGGLVPSENNGNASVIQWVGGAGAPEFSVRSSAATNELTFMINLRAIASPDELSVCLEHTLQNVFQGAEIIRQSTSCFAPAPPVPIHRMRQRDGVA